MGNTHAVGTRRLYASSSCHKAIPPKPPLPPRICGHLCSHATGGSTTARDTNPERATSPYVYGIFHTWPQHGRGLPQHASRHVSPQYMLTIMVKTLPINIQ